MPAHYFLFCAAQTALVAFRSMSDVPPPTQALVELAALLGEDNVRTLVRTFLHDFPNSLRDLGGGDRQQRHRVAHSMKSNLRLVGALDLSQRMAALEHRLSHNGEDVTAQEIAAIAAEYEVLAGPLRAFVG